MSKVINEMEKLRAQIDIIDQTILELIGDRHTISNRIGEIKKDMNLKILNPVREKELLENLKLKARSLNLDEKHVEEVWTEIMRESKRVQKHVSDSNAG
jgi:chorismate mutase